MPNNLLSVLIFGIPFAIVLFVGKRWFGRASDGGVFGSSSRDNWNETGSTFTQGGGDGGSDGGGDGGGGGD